MIGLILSPLGRVGLIGIGIAAFLGWFASDQRSRVVAKIEKASSHAVEKADSAGGKSRSPQSSGVLDQYVRD